MKIRKPTSLLSKLVLAFLLVAVATAALVAVFIRVTSADRLMTLIIEQQRGILKANLEAYYSANGSWQGVAENWQAIRSRSFPTPEQAAGERPPRVFFDRRSLFGLADAGGRVLVSVDPGYPPGATLPQSLAQAGTPLVVDRQRVGTILTVQSLPVFSPEENLFLRRTTEALIYAVAGAILVALVIAVALARTLTRPIHALTQAAEGMARGELGQQVRVTSRDEIGQLGQAFNQMSQEVARANLLKRQMTADIAHDLRTPLTVIAGYVESMRDGVLQPTPERLSLIYAEIERLQNLVEDLKMLSLVDAGELPLHPQPVSPQSLLERAAAPFQHRAETQRVSLSVDAPDGLPEVRVDDQRMMQVFSNLLSNAMRYTPEGGSIRLAARREDGQVVLTVADTGAGIPPEDLPHIFERFYRADKSRSAGDGESGLGLTIVKALVEAQGGAVAAESQPGQGTAFHIRLPQAGQAAGS